MGSVDIKNTLPVYSLSIELLKSGKLVHILMQTRGGNRYETQPFNPEKYITVSNFKYDESAKTVSFDISGLLFVPTSSGSVVVSGHFDNLSVKPVGCDALSSSLTALVETPGNRFDVETLNGGASVVSGLNGTDKRTYYQYFTLSNSFRVVFESATDFKTLPVGTYPIGTGSASPVKVTFEEYKGLSNPYNFYVYAASDWQGYRIDGTLTITNQTRLDGRPYTQGTIGFTAVDGEGKVVYNVRQGNFRLLNLQ